jgi:hypothetical protein
MKLNPYAWLAVLVIVASLVTGVWLHGRHRGVESMEDKVATKDAALATAASTLRQSAAALREVNAEAGRRIAAADAQAKAAGDVAKILAQATDAMKRQHKADEAAWKKAARNPDCMLLLTTDLGKTCGVMPR